MPTPAPHRPVVLLALLLALGAPLVAGAQQSDEKKPDPKPETKSEELPLKATEKVEFTTDEGTWMSLDLSPDGRTIVFDLLGDLYTLPSEGGEAKRIAGGISFESQPRFSPDGKKIVFLSDRSSGENVWIANADGSEPKPLTKGRNQAFCSPTWTPDGEYVLVSRSGAGIGTFALYLYHRDGGSGISLGGTGEGVQDRSKRPNRLGAVVAPDGRYVYFAQRAGGFSYNVTFPLWQVIRFDRETSETQTITSAQGSAMRPLITPDGKRLIYVTRYRTQTGLRVRDVETGSERWLIYPVTRDDQESRATRDTFPGCALTPEGDALIACLGGKIQRVELATGMATVIPFTAKVEAEIAPRIHFDYRVDDTSLVRARLARWPSLSPDGKRVVFTALNKLWLTELGVGRTRRLTQATEGEFMPSWSPDGQSVVYVTWTAEGGHICRVPWDGSRPPQRLTQRPAFYSTPVYTPDGSKIVFTTALTEAQLFADLRHPHAQCVMSPDEQEAEITGPGSAGEEDLRWMPAEGGESKLIGPAQGESPHFANDPNRVYLSSREGLVSIRLDGYDRRVHLKVTGAGGRPGGPPPGASELVVSPDGKRAFVDLRNVHYLVTIPSAGKETVEVNVGSASVPVKKLSVEGGGYLGWSRDGNTLTWALGAKFYRQEIAADKPEVTELVVEAPRARPRGTVVLRGARIVTMRGDEVIANGDLVVTENRIAAVGPKGQVKIPESAQVIDVTGKTIIPGYVDVHSHMWPPRGVHQNQVWQYLANLAYGVTTTRDPQSATTDVFAYTDLVETGDILGPRILTTGPGVFSQGWENAEAVRSYVKRYKDAYRTTTLKQYMSGDRIARQWVAQACKEFGLTPTTEGGLDMKLDLTQMADGFSGNEHSLPIQPLYRDVAEYVARTQTFYTPTLLVAYGAPWTENYWFQNTNVLADKKLARFVPHQLLDEMLRRREKWFALEEYGHRGIAEGCAKVVRAGGRVCLGSHGQLQGLGAHWEIWNLGSGGLTPHETLRCATLFGADAIGLQQDLGSLEPGKLADLQVLDRSPLDELKNISGIRYVMKNGELYEGETLNQVWPVRKNLGKQYWWEEEPAASAAVRELSKQQ
jgi:Tol biopolymer transport system component/imidazolonepropionase-like amidohydrolase